MTTIIQVPLDKLVPGDMAEGGSINSRKTPEPIDGLMRSIHSHGLLVPLLVRPNGDDGSYYVMDGNRRLAALNKVYGPTSPINVPCIEHAEGNALELSMVVNTDRAELHPVDAFEVFAALVEAGETIDAIAKRRGMKIAHVRQALALGRMAPAVRDAWRNGDVSAEAAEAFALTSDHKTQEAALKKAGKHPHKYEVRRLLVGNDHDSCPTVISMLKFVGRDAYENAGFQINDSLFSDENDDDATVSDLPALYRMIDDKIAAECEKLIGQGWKWAVADKDKPRDQHAWKRHYDVSKEQRGQLGCIVGLGYDGKFFVHSGIAKPSDKIATPKSPKQKKAETEARKERKEQTGGISDALSSRLSQQLTAAVREAFSKGAATDVAVACVIAVLACSKTQMSKLRFTIDNETASRHSSEFATCIKMMLRKTNKQRADLRATWLSNWLSQAIDLTVHHAPQLAVMLHPGSGDDQGARLLVEQINPARMAEALRKHFDAADYFASVSRDLVEQAVEEALGKDHAERVCALKTAALAKAYAIKHVGKTGWVPPQMRLGKAVLS
jgi:ParB family transcriptional regulator, chromosome partitioning protein